MLQDIDKDMSAAAREFVCRRADGMPDEMALYAEIAADFAIEQLKAERERIQEKIRVYDSLCKTTAEFRRMVKRKLIAGGGHKRVMNKDEREKLLDLNERLCREYNETEDSLVLEQIAVTEVLLFNDLDSIADPSELEAEC